MVIVRRLVLRSCNGLDGGVGDSKNVGVRM